MGSADSTRKIVATWDSKGLPASETSISVLAKSAPFSLPPAYLDLLRCANGGEGELAVDPLWFVLFSAEEVPVNNVGYEVEEFWPGYFVIGSSGGGVLLAFKHGDGDTVHQLDCCAAPEAVGVVAASFSEFLAATEQPP